MDLRTVFFASTDQDNGSTAGAINDQVTVAGTNNAQLIVEIAG
jgi:hypothetical protein